MKYFAILFILSLIVVIILYSYDHSHSQHNGHWSYEGETGPAHWGDLKPEYKMAKEGKQQSPIDIVIANVAKGVNELPIQLDYKPVSLEVLNNGHTIQCNCKGCNIKVADKQYGLLQFHFHTPSEHQVDGKPYPMEAHFVHKHKDGELAVIGLMIKEGKENKELAKIWEHMPTHQKTVQKKDVMIDITKILPKSLEYLSYDGSLTTPPCTEGVKWMVLSKMTIEASKEQIEKFTKIIGKNARPLQPLNGRIVTQY